MTAMMVIMALVGTGAILYVLWLQGVFLPGWISWQSREWNDASGEYHISLTEKKVEVAHDGCVIWTSGENVKVQDVLSCDIDNDLEDELVLLCWKRGRYGRARPFWVKEDEESWSQHLFVYEYNQGKIHAKWMSSYLGTEVAGLAAGPAQEPFSALLFTDTEGKVSCWRWDSWGFRKEETEVSFVVFGDNLIHEPIYRYGLNHNASFDFLYENVRDAIMESDVAVINQETPLTDNPDWYGDYPRFGTPVQVGQAIVDAGFDIVTCATNHALDRGAEGIAFTKDFFESSHVKCIGIQTEDEKEYMPFETVRRNNITFALLNYTYGTNGLLAPEEVPYMVHLLEEDTVRKDLAEADEAADFVIVFVHWGTEYSQDIDGFQQEWTRVFLEGGADVVVGSHPHALQPFEMLRDDEGHEMLVYYSLGNFVSSQQEKFCVRGGMADFTVSLTPEGYRVTEYGLRPLGILRDESGRITAGFLPEDF